MSVSLISQFLREVEPIPPEGVSIDSCLYQISVSKEQDTIFVTFKGKNLNSYGDSKLSGTDGFQQSLLKSLYRSLRDKRKLICEDYGTLLEECGGVVVQDVPKKVEPKVVEKKVTIPKVEPKVVEKKVTIPKVEPKEETSSTSSDNSFNSDNLVNIAPYAIVETDGTEKYSDSFVEKVNDGDYNTRWNAANDDIDTWIKFTWNTTQKINRIHITEFRSRIRGHKIEYGELLYEVEDLVMNPDDANASANHPNNRQKGVVVPDHILTFRTVETKILRYHVTRTTGALDEPSLYEIEIYGKPED